MAKLSVEALRLSVAQFLSQPDKEFFFWTFTFAEVLESKEAARRWHLFAKRLHRRYPQIAGIRVFEFHPGRVASLDGERHSHGLHVHCLIDMYLDVNTLRRLGKGLFGRQMNVKRITDLSAPERVANYIAKYLTKAERPPCLKGMRLWQNWGAWKGLGTRVKDVQPASAYRDFLRGIRFLATEGATAWEVFGVSQAKVFSLSAPGKWEVENRDVGMRWGEAFLIYQAFLRSANTHDKRRNLFHFLRCARQIWWETDESTLEKICSIVAVDCHLRIFE